MPGQENGTMKLTDKFSLKEINGQPVLMPTSVTAGSSAKVLCLNSSSAWLIGKLQGREFSFSDAAAMICENYGIDQARAESDLKPVFETLLELGAIER